METITIDDDFTVYVTEEEGEDKMGKLQAAKNELKWELEDYSDYSYNDSVNIKEDIELEDNYLFLSEFKNLEEIKKELEIQLKLEQQKVSEYDIIVISDDEIKELTENEKPKFVKVENENIERKNFLEKKQYKVHEIAEVGKPTSNNKVDKKEPLDKRKSTQKIQQFQKHRRYRPLRHRMLRSHPYKSSKFQKFSSRVQPFLQNHTQCQISQQRVSDIQIFFIWMVLLKQLSVQRQMQNFILNQISQVPGWFNTGVSVDTCIRQQVSYGERTRRIPVWANTPPSFAQCFQQQLQHTLQTVQMLIYLKNLLNDLRN